MSWIRKIFGITPSLSFDNLFDVPMIPPGVTTVEQVAEMIKDATHDSGIVVMVGAGMSTAAGIPDFRSSEGLYSMVKQLGLERPESLFDLEHFRSFPETFYKLASALHVGSHKPTLSHTFIRLLHDKQRLVRVYTQNVDCLEVTAGVPQEKVIEVHGSFRDAYCSVCSAPADVAALRTAMDTHTVMYCACGGPVKPGLIFFGEAIPQLFFDLQEEDFKRCRLLLIIGTSLKVFPFASLIDVAPPLAPRVLINREPVGRLVQTLIGTEEPHGLSFGNGRDVFLEGTCDEWCTRLARLLGWEDELLEMHKAS